MRTTAKPARTRPGRRPGPVVVGSASGRRRDRRGGPMEPQPPHVAAERFRKQDERHSEGGLGHGPRQDVCRGDGQHDPLYRSDGLAPEARRKRLTHPRQRPAGREECVACRADRQHPRADRAGDVDAEDEDQERVDLGVELRAQRPRRVRRATHPSTASSTSATAVSDTSSAPGTGWWNESPTSAAMPTASVARVRVTQSAGRAGRGGRGERPSASAAFMIAAQVSPTTQPAAPRPTPLRARRSRPSDQPDQRQRGDAARVLEGGCGLHRATGGRASDLRHRLGLMRRNDAGAMPILPCRA